MQKDSAFDIKIACWRKGQSVAQSAESLASCGEDGLVWIHIVSREREGTAAYLAQELGFHELEIEDALTEGERPHLHEDGTHFFFTVPVVRIQEDKLFFSELACSVSKGRLATVATEPIPLLDRWHERCCSRSIPEVRDAPRLLYMIVDAIVDEYYPAMDMLEDAAEDLEANVFGGRPVPIKALLRVKRRLLEVRRRLTPFRDILNGLLRHDMSLISKTDRIYFQDVYDHVLRVLELADLNRDILASVLDANLATVSNRLNQVMRVMTVIATVLMSVAVITGIYGMNFKFMPELSSPWGYPLAILSMAAVAAWELWLFRRKGWL